MPRIRVKLATRALLAGAAVVGATLVMVTPASAASAPTPPCPADHYCFYGDADYKGWHLNYKDTTSGDFSHPPYSSGEDRQDQLSSIINNTNQTICIYDRHAGRPDANRKVRPYEDIKNLGDFNDKANYWKVIVNC